MIRSPVPHMNPSQSDVDSRPALHIRLSDRLGNRVITLHDTPTYVGAGDAARVVITDAAASALHGAFVLHDGAWMYQEGANAAPTCIDGTALHSGQMTPLQEGTVLRIGGATIVVRDTVAPAPAAAPAPAPQPQPAPAPAPAVVAPLLDPLVLAIHDRSGSRRLQVTTGPATVGTDGDAAVRVHDSEAAPLQGRFIARPDGWYYEEDEPAVPTLLNSHPFTPRQIQLLRDGDTLQAGGATIDVGVEGGVGEVRQLREVDPRVHLTDQERANANVITIGSAIDNDIVISAPGIAAYHVEAWPTEGGFTVRNVDSAGHTQVLEGQSVELAPGVSIAADDVAEKLKAQPESLYQREHDTLEHLIVGSKLQRRVGKEQKLILDSVDVAVRRGQFVVVAGGSGAGKSTLMKLLNGYTSPSAGQLHFARGEDGTPALGYVPQDDIIHRELALRDALVLSAMLRYPAGTKKKVVRERADEVLRQLGLEEHARTRVSRLSGGQRKRASVALELMMKPRLLLLDEPTSGLDPASDHRLVQLLRSVANSGYGVVLITHTASDLPSCDTVAFLGPGGMLVFWGAPQAAMDFFGVTQLEDVYEKLDDAEEAARWREKFHATEHYKALRADVVAGLDNLGDQPATMAQRRAGLRRSAWQLRGLARRYWRTILGDRRNLIFQLAQFPVVMAMARLLFGSDTLTVAAPGSPRAPRIPDIHFDGTHGLQLLFFVGVTIVWLGTINAAREICKESAIWERERHVGVRPLPYLVSKVSILGLISLLQGALVVALMAAFWTIPGGATVDLQLGAVAILTSLVGMLMGLCISAAASSSDRAITIVPVAMIPQLLFGGVIVALPDMGAAGQQVSKVFASRWVFSAFSELTHRSDYLLPKLVPSYEITGAWTGPLAGLGALCGAFLVLAAIIVIARARE